MNTSAEKSEMSFAQSTLRLSPLIERPVGRYARAQWLVERGVWMSRENAVLDALNCSQAWTLLRATVYIS